MCFNNLIDDIHQIPDDALKIKVITLFSFNDICYTVQHDLYFSIHTILDMHPWNFGTFFCLILQKNSQYPLKTKSFEN